jgi:hypothetical protein
MLTVALRSNIGASIGSGHYRGQRGFALPYLILIQRLDYQTEFRLEDPGEQAWFG